MEQDTKPNSKYLRIIIALILFLIGVGLIMIYLLIMEQRGLRNKPTPVVSPPVANVQPSPSVAVPKPEVEEETAESPLMPDVSAKRLRDAEEILNGIRALQNPYTKLSPSHWGQPGYDKLAFTYDKMIDALAFKAAGHQEEAEEIVDYFVKRLGIPIEEAINKMDSNNVYGIVKMFRSPKDPKQLYKGLVNAVNITSRRTAGRGILEFSTTPGPLSFVAMTMLQINREKYLKEAVDIGNILLSMQDSEGGIHDGDREPTKIHTEPHMDAYDVFVMLYTLTGDEKWKEAAYKCYAWFAKNVFFPDEGIIWQGVWDGTLHKVLAEDGYSWPMSGLAGDTMSLDALKKTTEHWLSRCLSRVTVNLPDRTVRTLTLVDFTDSSDLDCLEVRSGKHAMGTIEWTGGAILALQKNAVRCWEAGDKKTAAFYKAIAEILMENAFNAFYYVESPGEKIYTSFYASGQGAVVGNFGSAQAGRKEGWKTPYYYALPANGPAIKGGSSVGCWVVLPCMGLNPFILDDPYFKFYDDIPYRVKDHERAMYFIDKIVATRSYTESIPDSAPDPDMQIREPANFNRKMWDNFTMAKKALDEKDKVKAQKYFKEVIRWATINAMNSDWIKMAKRDNELKQKEIGGLVYYSRGNTFTRNEDITHTIIFKYPLLNEIGASLWALAVANMEMGNNKESEYWIGRIIDDIPLHQIPATIKDEENGDDGELINGYWNALVAWEDNPGAQEIDGQMGALYREVLKKRGLTTAKPKEVEVKDIKL